jgi:hypothetical protein
MTTASQSKAPNQPKNGDRHRIEQQPLETRTIIARLAVEQLERIRRYIAVQEIGRMKLRQ